MKMKKTLALIFCLVIAFTFAACGGDDKEESPASGPLLEAAKEGFAENIGELSTGEVGETLTNSFFDWTLNSVETVDELHGKTPKEGYKFVVANVTVKNKVDYAYDTGNYDFMSIFDVSNEGMMDTLDHYYDGMYPDEQELGVGKTLEGDLVFEVDENTEELIIDYQEYYEDESVGNTNWFYVKL